MNRLRELYPEDTDYTSYERLDELKTKGFRYE